jgi:hypothetical protein
MHRIIIGPIFYKEIYESNLQPIIIQLQRKRVETILFNVSDGCTLTNELETLIRNYQFLHINHCNKNCNYILKRPSKPV